MAKWLNKYFSLGNNNPKSKSPPQPPRPDYKRNGAPERPLQAQYHHHTSPLPGREESDLIRAYRAQKERDFEDPYNGPGSSLRKLRAMCGEERLADGRRGRAPACSSSTSLFQEPYPGSSTNTTSSSSSSSSSPHLYRSNSERRPPGARQQQAGGGELKYIVSPKHRLIKIDSCGWGEPTGGGGISWSPAVTGGGGKEEQPAKKDKESQKPTQKNIQLYDTPYEPECNGVEVDSESLVGLRMRESKLPQDDDRPADEYDQPWEWNKALPALAAQFNGGEKRQSSPSPSSDRRRQLRAPGGGFKPIKHGSPELCGILGERVDPNVALEKQMSSQGFMHMKLSKAKEKYILGQNSPPFDSVPEVIHFYTTRKLPIKGAEHLSLLYPVAVRTL
ncbi:hypothetical protein GDO78_006798 [Eleutherodactylus coqui]|uniref:SH2 domain-containing adapter protein B n=1 Tax=Eleutherodactylus coqui TaxID=57060 RepID=A0A8J6KAC3_ELECQ|nr:hypothetical protein GDO78_006798 [Eleutherodactylus coqui]